MSIPLALPVPLLVWFADKPPEPEDVKAGWLGFSVFLLLAAAVVFLAFSLRKHLGKVDFEEPGEAEPAQHDDAAPGEESAPGPEQAASNGDRER
jgi:hypothetical protein